MNCAVYAHTAAASPLPLGSSHPLKQAYPLDLVRTRLAAQTSHSYYTGISQALRTIVADEGARGLYRGLGPTLLQVAPSLAINYAAYETMRSAWLARTDRLTPTVPMSLACGSAAGLISSTATFPLDLVRRRLQMRGWGGASSSGGGGGHAGQQATIRSMFSSVVQVGGCCWSHSLPLLRVQLLHHPMLQLMPLC
jgi:solute carrier family 25 phosphate transporter 23/24/25/41